MTERHVGEDAELGFQGGQQACIDRRVHQIADQRRIPSQPVGEGVGFQPLFSRLSIKVETEKRMSSRWDWSNVSAPKAGLGIKRIVRTSNKAAGTEERSTKTGDTKGRILRRQT